MRLDPSSDTITATAQAGDAALSKLIETRAEFQQLSEKRLVEAKALLDLGHWNGAYYLAGYAVELALKACIIKMLLSTDAFPGNSFSKDCYVHDIEKLVAVAKLESARTTANDLSPSLKQNWGTARDWSEQKRYHEISEIEARELYAAIVDVTDGVFPWIQTQW